jgi:hypothetical protein
MWLLFWPSWVSIWNIYTDLYSYLDQKSASVDPRAKALVGRHLLYHLTRAGSMLTADYTISVLYLSITVRCSNIDVPWGPWCLPAMVATPKLILRLLNSRRPERSESGRLSNRGTIGCNCERATLWCSDGRWDRETPRRERLALWPRLESLGLGICAFKNPHYLSGHIVIFWRSLFLQLSNRVKLNWQT